MADDQLPVVAQASEDETQSPFERIRHTDEGGDYWLARELMFSRVAGAREETPLAR